MNALAHQTQRRLAQTGLGGAPNSLASLPSGDAALEFVSGPTLANTGAVVGTFLLRGAIIGVGLLAAGARGRNLAVYTASAAGAVEVAVLGWAAYKVYVSPGS